MYTYTARKLHMYKQLLTCNAMPVLAMPDRCWPDLPGTWLVTCIDLSVKLCQSTRYTQDHRDSDLNDSHDVID